MAPNGKTLAGETTNVRACAARDPARPFGKSFELLDSLGWEHAAEVLPLLTAPTVTARGAEEDARAGDER